MNSIISGPAIVFFLGLGFILFVLCGIVTWTIRRSIRLNKLDPPGFRLLFFIAFLQVLLGGLTVLALRAINDNPVLDIGTGLGLTILSGLLFIKLVLKNDWRRSLRLWAAAAGMQVLLLPIGAGILIVAWVMFLFLLYPPQY